MTSLIMKVALGALIVFYVLKVFGPKKRGSGPKTEKRIHTEGLEVKDAEFSEVKEEKKDQV